MSNSNIPKSSLSYILNGIIPAKEDDISNKRKLEIKEPTIHIHSRGVVLKPIEEEEEVWKRMDISGYKPIFVSTLGRVKRSIHSGYTRPFIRYGDPAIWLLPTQYSSMTLRKRIYIDKLVMSAFVGEFDREIGHRDGDILNNKVSNLYYKNKGEKYHKLKWIVYVHP